MTGHRTIRGHWMIESAGDSSAVWSADYDGKVGYNDDIITAVTRAIDGLDPDEAEFVRMYYLRGMTYPQIAALIDCPRSRLISRHRSAAKKLRLRLHKMLAGRYNIPPKLKLDCPLCDHPRSAEIDVIIRARRERDTWRATMRVLKTRFNIDNIKPQTLITHRKYHLL